MKTITTIGTFVVASIASSMGIADTSRDSREAINQQAQVHHIRHALATETPYSGTVRSGYKWGNPEANSTDGAAIANREATRTVSYRWDTSADLSDQSSQSYAGTAGYNWDAMSFPAQSGYRWGTQSDSTQSGYRWGTQNNSEQAGYRWGTQNYSDQAGYRWGTQNHSDQAGYRWGTQNYSDQAGYRWGTQNYSDQAGYRWGTQNIAEQY